MKFFLFLLILLSNFVFGQQKTDQSLWHLTVVDSITDKGIDQATVSISKKKYYSTDANGIIVIDNSGITPKDSIIISSIGYKSEVLIVGVNYKFPNIIRLSPSVTALNEVKISARKPVKIKLGDNKKHYNSHSKPGPDYELVEYIPNDKHIQGTITSVEYVINDKLQGIEMPFKVGLYTKSKGNPFPDKELITDTIIVRNPERKRRISVDISKYNIQLPEDGVMAAFETLPPAYYGRDPIWWEGQQYLRVPGLDIDLKRKDDYDAEVHNNTDRKIPYAMVIYVKDKWSFEELDFHSYIYTEGNNFAIIITVSQ